MTRSTRIPTCLVALAVTACAPDAQPTVEQMEADIAAVNAVREQESAALAAGEANTAYLAADAVLMPPNQPTTPPTNRVDTITPGTAKQTIGQNCFNREFRSM